MTIRVHVADAIRTSVTIGIGKTVWTRLPRASNVAHPSAAEVSLFAERPRAADIEQLKQEIFGKYIRVDRPATAETDALTAELSSFIDCVQSNQQPLIDGKRGLAAMILADRVVEGVNKHQWDGQAEGPVGPFARPTQRRKLAG